MGESHALTGSLLQVNAIKFGAERAVLQNISFEQSPSEKLAIAGETGSGKSTLLKIIAGLEQPSSGTIYFEQKRIAGPDEQLVPGHPAIAYLPQDFELAHSLKVAQVLQYARDISTEGATTIYRICRIDHLLDRRTDELSGGERQRIALAQRLVAWPKLLLLDEPFSNLDGRHKTVLKEVLRDVAAAFKITLTLVSHDPTDTLSWADRLLILKAGKLVQSGSPQELYFQPKTPYVAGLLGHCTVLSRDQSMKIGKRVRRDLGGKRIFLRPEQIKVTAQSKALLEAQVVDRLFYGAYTLLACVSHGKTIYVQTQSSRYTVGSTVFLTFDADFWLI